MAATIRLLGPEDWYDLRSARLAALTDAPNAFVASLADEVTRTPEDWHATIKQAVWAGAWLNGRIVGIACLSAPELSAPTKPFIESVWVAPQMRRLGLARDLICRLEKVARRAAATHLQLWVLETNRAASDAYTRLGFESAEPQRRQDSGKPHVNGTFVQECLMVRMLS